jgi:methylenetetrahydrofolate dehydrogenase (NADP+)/methenyltetrahydrofolate cyclohydrolase
VIDVGTSQVCDRTLVERLFPPDSRRRHAFARRGSIVVGDVHPDVAEIAGALSPVPGGVGPLTIAMLLKNTLSAAQERAGWAGRAG